MYFPTSYLLQQCEDAAVAWLAAGGTDQPTIKAMIFDCLSRGANLNDADMQMLFAALT